MIFITAFLIAAISTPFAGALGRKLGFVDRPEGSLEIHQRPTPVLGGPAVVGAASVAFFLQGATISSYASAAVLVCLGIGLWDDVRPLPPRLRLAAQTIAGLLLLLGGIRGEPLGTLGLVGVVVSIPVLANAVNIIDGQDGLAGAVVAIAALGLAALSSPPASAVGLASAGALAGFLLWNRPPAQIFLGNGGAYALGALLAISAGGAVARSGWQGVVASALCLGVLLFELAFTVGRRLASRTSLASGDRLHSYDLLAARFSRLTVTALFGLAGLGLAALAVLAGQSFLTLWAVAAVTAVVGIWTGLALLRWAAESTGRHHL